MVHARNLIGSAGATVSCQNLSYNLGSTNGYLDLTNLAGNSLYSRGSMEPSTHSAAYGPMGRPR